VSTVPQLSAHDDAQHSTPDVSAVQVDTPAAAPGARRLLIVAEAVVSVGMALLMVLLARTIEVSPLDRIGQVSGLAGLQLRFALLGVVLLIAVVVTTRIRWPSLSSVVTALAAAAAAGLSTGLIAGAIIVALRGTSVGLAGGDTGNLLAWTRTLMATNTMPDVYPPAFINALAWYSELTGDTPERSLKVMQVLWTALVGPATYLAWRPLLPPLWALGIGTVIALPLIEPYKPYTTVTLPVLIPVLVLLLQRLRRSGHASWRRLVVTGAGFGLALGAIFLVYSGWFVWSAPGVLVAALVVFPWRRTEWWRGLTLLITTAAVFVLVTSRHLLGLLGLLGSSEKDRYFYFDTWTEPTYIAMWRNGLPVRLARGRQRASSGVLVCSRSCCSSGLPRQSPWPSAERSSLC
jgi:galactan 5-O-arabinofuranosyltransferase